MFNTLIAKVAAGWLRTLIAGLGGSLAGAGYLDQSQAQQFQGALLILLPILWSAFQKWSAQNKADQAILKTAKASAAAGQPILSDHKGATQLPTPEQLDQVKGLY